MPAAGTLTYSITGQSLTGSLKTAAGGVVKITIFGNSGGRGGSTTLSHPIAGLANNPAAMCVKAVGDPHSPNHTEGGPIPIGMYRLLRSTARGKNGWIPIEPWITTHMCRRDSFYIHWRGPHGSDGCIVIEPFDFDRLKTLVDAAAKAGDGRIGCDLRVTY